MKRLTVDNPSNNTEALLNFAYAKDGRVYLSAADGEENVDLCEYIANNACCKEITAEAVMDGACMECDCKTSILYIVAVQAAELRARLAAYEDTGLTPEQIHGLRVLLEDAISDLKFASGSSCVYCKHFDSNSRCTSKEPCFPNDNWEWKGLEGEGNG